MTTQNEGTLYGHPAQPPTKGTVYGQPTPQPATEDPAAAPAGTAAPTAVAPTAVTPTAADAGPLRAVARVRIRPARRARPDWKSLIEPAAGKDETALRVAAVAAGSASPVRVRKTRRRMIRGAEIGVWTVAVAVALVTVAFVIRTQGLPGEVTARFLVPPAGPPGLPCVFEPCPQSDVSGAPTAVRIPSIGVESPLELLALDENDELIPPETFEHAGWYAGGVVPGDIGAAVLAGHVDSLAGEAVFFDLATLAAGDRVEVERGGRWIAFVVTSVERYPKDDFPNARVYQPTPGPELRLITCGGGFNATRGSYRDNIVVYAVAA